MGLDVWNFNTARADERTVRAEAAELRAFEERFHEEVELADHLAAQLAVGTISLAEATNLMEPILRNRPGFATVTQQNYHAPTFRQGVAWYLIQHVDWQLLDAPEVWAAISTRLEAEYVAMQ